MKLTARCVRSKCVVCGRIRLAKPGSTHIAIRIHFMSDSVGCRYINLDRGWEKISRYHTPAGPIYELLGRFEGNSGYLPRKKKCCGRHTLEGFGGWLLVLRTIVSLHNDRDFCSMEANVSEINPVLFIQPG